MALAAVSTTIRDWWLAVRPGTGLVSAPAGIYTALVSDLAVGDYVLGIRAKVTATGATASGVRTFTVQKVNSGEFTVSWPAAQTVMIGR
jgi:hypothetical protein